MPPHGRGSDGVGYNQGMSRTALRPSRYARLGPLALGFLLLGPAPFFALLCRGHSPSRFETVNLPVWERRPPPPAAPSPFFRLPPAPPGAVRIPGNPWVAALLRADEDRLLAGLERPGRGDAGAAGAWLEAACAWGREPDSLTAKQDRVANRLLATQAEDGTFGPGGSAPSAARRPWSPAEAAAQRSCLRGLLAYYAAAGRPAAIQAALSAGGRMAAAAQSRPDPAWIYPLARLFQETDDPRFLTAARRQAALSDGSDNGDGLGLCALYEATGQPALLARARQEWARGPHSQALTAEMLLLTGRPGYAAALERLPPDGPEMARAAWTRAPLGLAVNTRRDSAAVFHGLRLEQKTAGGVRAITVGTATPRAAWLRVFLPPGQPARIWINGVAQATPAPAGGYALLARRWREGDRIEVGYVVSKSQVPKGLTAPSRKKPLHG